MATFVRVQEVEHEIGTTGQFELRVTSPDVEIRAIDGTTAHVRIEFAVRATTEAEADEIFERARFRVRQSAGVLSVSEPKEGDSGLGSIVRILAFGGAKVDARIVAEVPTGAAVTYVGVSADLIGIGLVGTQEYRTVSGDLVLSDMGGQLRVNGVSGDVSLRADAPIRLQANTVSGDLSAIAPRLDECRVVTVSGDVELEGELAGQVEHRVETVSGDLSLGAVSGLTLEVRGLSTDVDINLAHRSEGSRDRRRYVIGDGAAQLLFSSMSGDVSVATSRRILPRLGRVPAPPTLPSRPTPPTPHLGEDEQLRILRALERGEIDVDEASRRLAGGI
jgi:Putative adhesin